jgi:hypothetical protein
MTKPPIETDDTTEKTRRKPRNIGRIVHEINRLSEDEPEKLEFLGSVPDIPQSNIRLHIKKNYGAGFFLIQTKQGGKFKGEYEIQIQDLLKQPESEETQNNFLEIEPEIRDFEENDFEASSNNSAILEALLREIKDLRLRESERLENTQNANNETLQMMREMQRQSEKSFQHGLEMAKILTSNNQPQAQGNPTQMMLEMLKGTLEVQRGVRELSEEISPNESGSSSLIADGAKLLDSLGRNAGSLLPVLTGALGRNRQTTPMPQTVRPTTNGTNGNGTNGELSELANKLKSKKDGKK